MATLSSAFEEINATAQILHAERRNHAQRASPSTYGNTVLTSDSKDRKVVMHHFNDNEHYDKRQQLNEIMEKTKDAVKRQLKEQWKQACKGFLDELLRMWKLDAHYGYWIGNEVGSVYDYGDGMFTINMDDIIYCVENDVTESQYTEWQEYICDAAEFGFTTPNLRSWMHGCPRTSPEAFEKLRDIKRELEKAVEDGKERVKAETGITDKKK